MKVILKNTELGIAIIKENNSYKVLKKSKNKMHVKSGLCLDSAVEIYNKLNTNKGV